MKKGLTEMLFILDRSGSMSGLETETIGGYNGLIEKQRHVEGSAIVNTVLLPEEEKPEHTIVVITTDGEENSSREYTLEKVKRLVKRMQEKHNWEFMFLGANIDAISAAGRIGISADRAVRYKSDRRGTALNYKVVGEAMACMRACRKPISKDWKAEIEEDVARRGE